MVTVTFFYRYPYPALKQLFKIEKSIMVSPSDSLLQKIFNVAFTLLFCDEQEGRKKIFYSVFLDYFLGEEKQSLWTRKTASLGSKSRIETLNKG